MLFQDSIFMDYLTEAQKGFFISEKSIKPQVGAKYRLVVTSPDLDEAISTGFERIPEAPSLDSIEVRDSASVLLEVFNNPVITVYPSLDSKTSWCVYSLTALFSSDISVDGSDLYFEEAQDCKPGKIAFRYAGFRGKDISCISQGFISLGWYYNNPLNEGNKYIFSWGVVNESGARFFESSGTFAEQSVESLLFQPATIESNISGAYGVFTAFNTSDYPFRF